MARTRSVFELSLFLGLTLASTSLRGQTVGFAYVANCGSQCGGVGPASVSAYTIDGTIGVLTPVAGSPFEAGSASVSVTVDPTGQFAYVANFLSNDISAYTIDGSTGALTPIASSPFAAGSRPRSVTTTAGPPRPAPTPPAPSYRRAVPLR